MASSTLDPDNLPLGNDRVLGRAHGTGALGPSGSSDSGTGERAAAGRDVVIADGADIDVDHIETIAPDPADLDIEALPTEPERLGGIETLATEAEDVADVEAAPLDAGDVERGPGRGRGRRR